MSTYKIKPTTYLLIAIILMISFDFLLPIKTLISTPWTFLGILPLIVGLVINARADRTFHLAGTAVCPFQTSSALVTDGPYRWSRNPMYLGFTLVLIGVAALLGSLSPYVIVIAFALLINARFIRMEEQKMAAIFGTQWEMYKERTRRWL
jgi:protein-S-isoprenylcysteine O-methyltransferase Ste14